MKKYNLNPTKIFLLIIATLGIILEFTFHSSLGLLGVMLKIVLTVVLFLLFAYNFDEMDKIENVAEGEFTKEELITFFIFWYMSDGTALLVLFGLNPPY